MLSNKKLILQKEKNEQDNFMGDLWYLLISTKDRYVMIEIKEGIQ